MVDTLHQILLCLTTLTNDQFDTDINFFQSWVTKLIEMLTNILSRTKLMLVPTNKVIRKAVKVEWGGGDGGGTFMICVLFEVFAFTYHLNCLLDFVIT